MYINLILFWNYNYIWYGIYMVIFVCNNIISLSIVVFIMKVVLWIFEMSINYNGLVMVKNVVMLNFIVSEIGYCFCFILDFGNSCKVVFGLFNCILNDGGYYFENLLFVYFFMLYNYSYSIVGVYNIIWSG